MRNSTRVYDYDDGVSLVHRTGNQKKISFALYTENYL